MIPRVISEGTVGVPVLISLPRLRAQILRMRRHRGATSVAIAASPVLIERLEDQKREGYLDAKIFPSPILPPGTVCVSLYGPDGEHLENHVWSVA